MGKIADYYERNFTEDAEHDFAKVGQVRSFVLGRVAAQSFHDEIEKIAENDKLDTLRRHILVGAGVAAPAAGVAGASLAHAGVSGLQKIDRVLAQEGAQIFQGAGPYRPMMGGVKTKILTSILGGLLGGGLGAIGGAGVGAITGALSSGSKQNARVVGTHGAGLGSPPPGLTVNVGVPGEAK